MLTWDEAFNQPAVTAYNYVAAAMRTVAGLSQNDMVLNAALGISGETDELITESDSAGEGDVFWYIAEMLAALLPDDGTGEYKRAASLLNILLIVARHGNAAKSATMFGSSFGRVLTNKKNITERVKKYHANQAQLGNGTWHDLLLKDGEFVAGLLGLLAQLDNWQEVVKSGTMRYNAAMQMAGNVNKLRARHPDGFNATYRGKGKV